MRTAIIGYAGFLGHTLTRHLVSCGNEVYGFGHHKAEDLSVPFVRYDAAADVPCFPPGTDAVFYLAQSPFYRNFPEQSRHLFAVNTLGPLTAATAAAEAGVKFFCFASTGNVYAPSFAPLTEQSPLDRSTAYGLSKIMGEEALALFSGTMHTLSARLFGLFGPGQKAMLPWFLQNAVRNEQDIFLEQAPGEDAPPGGVRVSFLFAPDCAAILSELAKLSLAGDTLPRQINIGGERAIAIKEYAESLGAILGKVPRFMISAKRRNTDFIADISLLQGVVAPRFTPFETALAATCAGQ